MRATDLTAERPVPRVERRAVDAATLRTVTLVIIPVIVAAVLLVAVAQGSVRARALVTAGALLGLGAAVLWCASRNAVRSGGWLLVSGLILSVTLNAIPAGGLRSPGVAGFVVFVLMGGFLLGHRAGYALGVLCASIGFGFVVAEWAGALPPAVEYTALSRWILSCIYIGFAIVIQRFAFRSMRHALDRAATELAERRDAERRLQLALDAAGVGVWERDVASDVFHGDARLREVWGIPPEAPVALTSEMMRTLIHPDDREKMARAQRERDSGTEHIRTEFRIVRPDGQLRHLESSALTIRDEAGRPTRIIGLNSDVTWRHDAEREREALLAAVQERVKELTLLHSATKLLQREKRLDSALLGELVALIPPAWQYPDVCVARITFGDHHAASPGWRETPWMISADLRSAGATGRVSVAYLEARPAAADGPFLAEERAVLDSLTELLQAHADREHAETLRQSVEGQLRQSQKMEALGTLAGGIAHDFNNILTAISGNAQLARDLAVPGSPLHEHVEQVSLASERAADLVRRILTFSRKSEARRRTLKLATIVGEVAKLLRTNLPAGVRIEVEAGPDLPTILADTSQMHQVLMNLGTNAIHAMRESGGTLTFGLATVDHEPSTVGGGLRLSEGRYLRVRVSDSGTGMSPEVLQRIFEPFFSTKGHQGTGLGMSVVHGIIEEHEGTITVESILGSGTTIELYFPTAADEAAAPRQATIPQGAGQRVLYVDDEEAVLFVMTRMARRLGYEVTPFADPHAALQAFRSAPGDFDCAVMDNEMPGLSGRDLARLLREIRPGFPIARSSGQRQDEAEAEADGVVLLAKPVFLESLALALHRMASR